jgi:hypothetical protein
VHVQSGDFLSTFSASFASMLLDFGIFTVGFYAGILFFLTIFRRREEE